MGHKIYRLQCDEFPLLNNGQELEARVDLLPSHHRERPYLRIRNLPTNEITGEVLVIKLEFGDSVND